MLGQQISLDSGIANDLYKNTFLVKNCIRKMTSISLISINMTLSQKI